MNSNNLSQKFSKLSRKELVDKILEQEKQEEMLHALYRVSELLVSDLDFDTVAQKAVDLTLNSLGESYPGAILFLYHGRSEGYQPYVYSSSKFTKTVSSRLPMDVSDYRFKVDDNADHPFTRVQESKTSQSLSSIVSTLSPEVPSSFARWIDEFMRLKEVLVIPLLVKGHFLGIFQLHSDHVCSEREKNILITYTQLVGLAMHNAIMMRRFSEDLEFAQTSSRVANRQYESLNKLCEKILSEIQGDEFYANDLYRDQIIADFFEAKNCIDAYKKSTNFCISDNANLLQGEKKE